MNEPNDTRQEGREDTVAIPDVLPAMALKDAVLFPFVMVPLSIGRDRSVAAVDQALAESRLVLLLTQPTRTRRTRRARTSTRSARSPGS